MKESNKKLLEDFTKYCTEHPEERFWQALRNWSEADHIFAISEVDTPRDTFYWEGKNE